MPDKDYYSFDEVLSDLRMEEDELKRLVSAGEIRAFRDQDTMRFKAADVERLKPTDGGGAEADDDLELDLEDELDLGEELDLGGSEELVLEDDGGEVEELDLAAGSRSSRRGSSAPQRSAPRSQAVAAEASDSPGIIFALVLGFILLIFANFAALGAVAGRANALTGFLADMFSS